MIPARLYLSLLDQTGERDGVTLRKDTLFPTCPSEGAHVFIEKDAPLLPEIGDVERVEIEHGVGGCLSVWLEDHEFRNAELLTKYELQLRAAGWVDYL